MKRLKAGPELKMPDLKVPPFLVDVYWDLRERRLLPFVALVVIAIVAAPILLGGGSGEGASPAPVTSAPQDETMAQASTLTVVQAKPGLREYRKRLAHRTPADPFKPRYTSPPPSQAGPELGPETTSSGESSTGSDGKTLGSLSSETPSASPSEPSEGSDPASGESESTGGGGDSKSPSHLTLFAFAIDVKITKIEGSANSKAKPESSVRHEVMPTTPLPGEKAPVVTYMGVGKGAKKALLMVSNNVKSIYGDAKCLSGTDTCQLLEVEPGFPETFVYGDNDVRYKVNVLKIEAVPVGHS
jgi:hypothetical protein